MRWMARRCRRLGCGLGVTATAALAAGADLYVADYSPLSLAFCAASTRCATRGTRRARSNSTGASRCRRCCAWLGPLPAFPLILAADILYEDRDVAPVCALIDRLLAPDGQLWLAEPGRKTARAFLNTLAAAGWRCTTERAGGPWPGDLKAQVRLHLLERPRDATA